jgi:hypothetical protein
MSTGGKSVAFGAPGIAPRWTSSAKEGLGTAYSGSCQLWFTLSHGIINEIYYPTVDQPNTRDFEFLISDGKAFCHEEKSDPDNRIDYPERGCLFYRLINSERNGRYQIIKRVLADPDRSVLLMHTRAGTIRFVRPVAPISRPNPKSVKNVWVNTLTVMSTSTLAVAAETGAPLSTANRARIMSPPTCAAGTRLLIDSPSQRIQ